MGKAMIWCLFSRYNDYDQPGNVLVGWWWSKPDIATIAEAMGQKFPCVEDEATLAVVKVWSDTKPYRLGQHDWRLMQTTEGIIFGE